MFRLRAVLAFVSLTVLLTGCTVDMPTDTDPSDRGELRFTVRWDDGEPASGFDYHFEPSVANSGGVSKFGNGLRFRNFPAQDYTFTFTHPEATESVTRDVTVLPNGSTDEEVQLTRSAP